MGTYVLSRDYGQLLCQKVFCTSKQHYEENEQLRGGMIRAEEETNHPDVSYISSLTVWRLL